MRSIPALLDAIPSSPAFGPPPPCLRPPAAASPLRSLARGGGRNGVFAVPDAAALDARPDVVLRGGGGAGRALARPGECPPGDAGGHRRPAGPRLHPDGPGAGRRMGSQPGAAGGLSRGGLGDRLSLFPTSRRFRLLGRLFHPAPRRPPP